MIGAERHWQALVRERETRTSVLCFAQSLSFGHVDKNSLEKTALYSRDGPYLKTDLQVFLVLK